MDSSTPISLGHRDIGPTDLAGHPGHTNVGSESAPGHGVLPLLAPEPPPKGSGVPVSLAVLGVGTHERPPVALPQLGLLTLPRAPGPGGWLSTIEGPQRPRSMPSGQATDSQGRGPARRCARSRAGSVAALIPTAEASASSACPTPSPCATARVGRSGPRPSGRSTTSSPLSLRTTTRTTTVRGGASTCREAMTSARLPGGSHGASGVDARPARGCAWRSEVRCPARHEQLAPLDRGGAGRDDRCVALLAGCRSGRPRTLVARCLPAPRTRGARRSRSCSRGGTTTARGQATQAGR